MGLKILDFIKKHVNELVFTIGFIVVLFGFAMPFSDVTLRDGSLVTISFASAFSGSVVDLGGQSFALSGTSVLLIVSFVLLVLSEGLVIANCFFKEKKVKTILQSIALAFLGINIFLVMLGGYCLCLIDFPSLGASGAINQTFGIVITLFEIVMALSIFSLIFSSKRYSVQEICETAILVALAVVLDQFLKIQIQANGGSISFSALPLFIIAIRYGAFKGFVASGLIFGFLTCLLDGYGFQTFPFDYLVALSGYGLVGTFYNFAKRFYKNIEDPAKYKKMQFVYSFIFVLLSTIPVMLVRYVGHMISACILYGYDPITGFWGNFVYQSTYVPGAVGISMAGMLVLLEPVIMINRIFPVKKVEGKEESN